MKAIIILGGRINDDGTLGFDSISRVDEGIKVYRKTKNSKLIMSGAYSFIGHRPKILEATSMKRYALSRGVNSKDILLEEKSLDTLSNLYFSKKILIKYGWKNIAIVTSDYHIKRTKYAAIKIFGPTFELEFIPAESDIGFTKISDQLKEFFYRMLYRIYLRHVIPGDDKQINDFFKNKHPAYKTTIN